MPPFFYVVQHFPVNMGNVGIAHNVANVATNFFFFVVKKRNEEKINVF